MRVARTALAAAVVCAVALGLGQAVGGSAVLPLGIAASSRPPRLWTAPDWYVATDLAAGRTNADNLVWLESGRVPGVGTAYEPMVRSALLDLRRLSRDNGAVAAGAGPKWNYDWPRDTAFVAVALDRSGHAADAQRALRFLAEVQGPDGSLEARYLLDGSGVPDARPRQDDGPGWVLWAVATVVANPAEDGVAHDPPRPAGVRLDPEVRRLADRSLAHLLATTANGSRLPAATPDYWEVPQQRPSLGLVAPMLAGLRSAAGLYDALGDKDRAARATAAATRFDTVVRGAFAPSYQRFGRDGGRDAAVAMLMPPFAPESPSVAGAWVGYQGGAVRPGGGLAPGTAWRQHGESWTPETALVAYTAAASGRTVMARQWMDWLDAHRTPWGALPEKVMPDGSAAGPAPLAWTAALVVLTADELDRTPPLG